jgi:preprotein translocase subunit Sec61beta
MDVAIGPTFAIYAGIAIFIVIVIVAVLWLVFRRP